MSSRAISVCPSSTAPSASSSSNHAAHVRPVALRTASSETRGSTAVGLVAGVSPASINRRRAAV